MLQFQLLFFVSTALGAVALAWGAPTSVRTPLRYAFMFVGSWLASATVLFLGTWILNPIDPTLYFPTSMAAQVAPLLAIAGAMSLVGVWSRDGKVLLALSLSAAFA